MIAKILAVFLLAATPPVRSAVAPVQTAYRRSPYVGAISADAATKRIFFSSNADQPAYPASVTKLMTALLVLEDVRAGKYRLTDLVTATADVYRSEPSWVGLKVGEKMSVDSLLTALMVESANDAAIALAVHASGSLDAFVARMNTRAKALKMERTTYYNPNGLPPGKHYPWKKFNVTTASDQLKLALELVNRNPQILKYTSVKTAALIKTDFGYRVVPTRRSRESGVSEPVLASGEKLVKTLRNHNNVMVKDKQKVLNPDGKEAVDGLKTGYIDAGGSSVVVTGQRRGKRVIAVVLGSSSAKERDGQVATLLEDALGTLVW